MNNSRTEGAGIAYRDVEPLLRPKSITIVGASERPNSWSARIVRNLRRYGFPGSIQLVNPRHRTLYNSPCFPTVLDVPEGVDQMVVIVPAELVPSVIEQGGRRGCRSAVIFSGGFSETGEASGMALEREMLATADRYGVLLGGPNTLGNISTRERVLTFAEFGVEDYLAGGLALVSQSSGLMGGVTRHAHMRALGLSYCVASGSEANVEAADYLHFLVEDPNTRVIGLFLEAIRRPKAFATACERARALKKPILILKIGKSRKGQEAVLTHTGALAGSYDAFVAFCRKYGLIEIRGLAECIDAAELFLRSSLPKTKGIAAISLSGGGRSYLLDMAEELNLSFPNPSHAAREQIQELLGVGAGVGNPLDLGAAGASDPQQQLRCVELLGSDPAVGLIAFQAELPQGSDAASRAAGLQKLAERAAEMGKPIVFFSRSCYSVPATPGEKQQQWSTPFLQDIRRSFQAIAHFTAYGAAVEQMSRDWNKPSETESTSWKGAIGTVGASAPSFLSDQAAFALLESAGFTVARYETCGSKQEALQAAERIGYPVALKASLAGLTHKNQSGGVLLSLRGSQDVANAFDSIQSKVGKLHSSLSPAPNQSCERPIPVMVQEMVQGVLELYVGGRWDREFGPLVLFGFGGLFVEVLGRTCTRLAPVEAQEAEQMISESGVGQGLLRLGLDHRQGYQHIIDAVVRISQLIATTQELDTVEVNPLLFRDEKSPCVAVDVVALHQFPSGGTK